LFIKIQSKIKSLLKTYKQREFYFRLDVRWALVWAGGIFILWLWDVFFLNDPARLKLEQAFVNTISLALLVVLISSLLAWGTTLLLEFGRHLYKGAPFYVIDGIINLIRSVPQVLGILIGYVLLSRLLEYTTLSSFEAIIWIAFIISLFVFLDIADLMRERISFFKKSDFYDAMRVNGVREVHIINYEILYKSSRIHIFNKLISVFGMTFFLLCSVDFIVSVGLASDINLVNFPATLGSMLANIDSKQDILALGATLQNPFYITRIFFEHLQGVSVAFSLVFTLLSVFKISEGVAREYHL